MLYSSSLVYCFILSLRLCVHLFMSSALDFADEFVIAGAVAA